MRFPAVPASPEDQYRAAARLFALAQQLGVNIEHAESWGQLASLVSDRLGSKCYLCGAASFGVGFWIPADRSLLGPEVSWIGYLHCGNHTVDEIETKIAEKYARTS